MESQQDLNRLGEIAVNLGCVFLNLQKSNSVGNLSKMRMFFQIVRRSLHDPTIFGEM